MSAAPGRPATGTACAGCGGSFWWLAPRATAWRCWRCDPPADAENWQRNKIEIANSRPPRDDILPVRRT